MLLGLYVCVYEQAFLNVPALSDRTIRRDIAASDFTTGPDIQVSKPGSYMWGGFLYATFRWGYSRD